MRAPHGPRMPVSTYVIHTLHECDVLDVSGDGQICGWVEPVALLPRLVVPDRSDHQSTETAATVAPPAGKAANWWYGCGATGDRVHRPQSGRDVRFKFRARAGARAGAGAGTGAGTGVDSGASS